MQIRRVLSDGATSVSRSLASNAPRVYCFTSAKLAQFHAMVTRLLEETRVCCDLLGGSVFFLYLF